MPARPPLLLSTLALLLFPGAPALAAGELRTSEAVRGCNEGNLPERTSIETVSLQAKDRIGAITTSKAKLYWRKFDDGLSKVMMRFFAPPDLRNSALLMLENRERENDLFIYLPELGRVKRITSRMTSSSMYGTDFSYEEFERLQGLAKDSPSVLLGSREVQGRGTYVLETHPTEESKSAYERIVSFIDHETCTLIRSEFYERGEAPRKILSAEVSSITHQVEDIWVVRRYVMRDLRDETETEMIIESVEIGVDIPRKRFSERELLSGGR